MSNSVKLSDPKFHHVFNIVNFRETLEWLSKKVDSHLNFCDSKGFKYPKPLVIYTDKFHNTNTRDYSKIQSFIDAVRFFTPVTVPDRYADFYFGCWITNWKPISNDTDNFRKISEITFYAETQPRRLDRYRTLNPCGKRNIRVKPTEELQSTEKKKFDNRGNGNRGRGNPGRGNQGRGNRNNRNH